jgi:hypothetical protein
MEDIDQRVADDDLERALDDPDPDEDDDPDLDPDLGRVLTAEQLAAVEILATGGTVAAAAAAAGVARRVADKWRTDDPVFVAELNARKQDRLDRVQGRLRGLAEKAVAAVEKMIEDDGVPAAVRLRAVQLVLDASGGLQKADQIGPCEPADARWAIEKRHRDSWLDAI